MGLRVILAVLALLAILGTIGIIYYFAGDFDGDGLPNGEEMRYGTNLYSKDSDGDGLWDSDEINIYHTNPLSPDTDHDKLTDLNEITVYRTDPLKNDTDQDKLIDGDEVNKYHTNPNFFDTDNDTLSDYEEIMMYKTDPLSNDTDHDGINDYLELTLYKTDPKINDTDHDGLLDGTELLLNTDPLSNDTDHDGFIDSVDLCPLHDMELNITIKHFVEEMTADRDSSGDPYVVVEVNIVRKTSVEKERFIIDIGYNVSEAWNITPYIYNVPDDIETIYLSIMVFDNDTVDGKTSDQLYDIYSDPELTKTPQYILNIKYTLLTVNETPNHIEIIGDGTKDTPNPDYPDAIIELVIETIFR